MTTESSWKYYRQNFNRSLWDLTGSIQQHESEQDEGFYSQLELHWRSLVVVYENTNACLQEQHFTSFQDLLLHAITTVCLLLALKNKLKKIHSKKLLFKVVNKIIRVRFTWKYDFSLSTIKSNITALRALGEIPKMKTNFWKLKKNKNKST